MDKTSNDFWAQVEGQAAQSPTFGESKTEDEVAFGKDAWVYCNQHVKPHQTGWCTVSVRDKVGLGIFGPEKGREALQKCKDWGFALANQNAA